MKNYLKRKIKIEKGFTGQDILVAVFVMMLFLSIISALMLNLTKTTVEINRMQEITETLSIVMDNVDALKFGADEIDSEVQDAKIESNSIFLNNVRKNANIDFTYSVSINTEDGKTEKKIIVKGKDKKSNLEISMEISKYCQETISENTLEVNEDTTKQWPFNRPTSNEMKFNNTVNVTPIKFVWDTIQENSLKGHWTTTTVDDLEWYSIDEGIFPTYITTSGVANAKKNYDPFAKAGTNSVYPYIWIPAMRKDKYTENWYYQHEKNTTIISNSISGKITDYSSNFSSDSKLTTQITRMNGVRGYIARFYNDKFYYNNYSNSSIMSATYLPSNVQKFLENMKNQHNKDI